MRLQTFLATGILIFSSLSQATAAVQTPAGMPDFKQLKRDIRVFSSVMDTVMRDAFQPPYGLLETTKGAYLPGFGLVFSLEVNLVALRQRSPFDPRPLTPQELDQAFKLKQQRIGELEQRILPKLLADYGANIEMPATDRLGIVIHLFNFPEEDHEELPTRLVGEVSRQDMLDYKTGKMPFTEFAKRVQLLKF